MRESPWMDEEYTDLYLKMNRKYDEVAGDEVEYLIKKFNLKPGMRVLDLGCGYGRHSVEFGRRGFRVTGVDISPQFIEMAKERSEGMDVEFLNMDVLQFRPEGKYDLVINMYTSILGELGGPNNDLEFLKIIRDALKDTGHFVITTLNAFRQVWKGNEKFDPVKSEIVWRWSGKGRMYQEPIHLYTPMEIYWMCRNAGLDVIEFFGIDVPGDIVHEKPFTIKSIEIGLTGRKSG